jgi:hypothetical protein
MPGWQRQQHRIAKVCFILNIITSSAKEASEVEEKGASSPKSVARIMLHTRLSPSKKLLVPKVETRK